MFSLKNNCYSFALVLSLFYAPFAHADAPLAEKKSESLLQQLVNSYVSSSKEDNALRHLLDAKMYLSEAEHDLLVSHNKESAKGDIESSLGYLLEAEKTIQKPDLKQQLVNLVETLKGLEQKIVKTSKLGSDNESDELLTVASGNLLKAKEYSTPKTQKSIDKIIDRIQLLQKEIEHTNLRSDYESAMDSLSNIISNL